VLVVTAALLLRIISVLGNAEMPKNQSATNVGLARKWTILLFDNANLNVTAFAPVAGLKNTT
jgi:hypothetical protein